MANPLQTILRAQTEGKALGTHPAFMDPGVPVGVTDLNQFRRGQNPNATAGISQKEANRHLDSYGGAQAMDWVMDCVRYTADTVANAEYHFQPPAVGGRKVPGEATEPPPALGKLLDAPNPYMDYIEMMELLIIDLLLVGNAYWFKWRTNAAGQALAVYRLAPGMVKVQPAPWGVKSYEYQVPGMEKLLIDPSEIIHFKMANPHNPHLGLGLIQGAGRSADLELSLTDSQASYFDNHALPSLAVASDRRVPRDVFKKLRAQLRARTQGPRNAGELLVLEAGLKLQAIAPNAAEAAFAELSRLSRDRIFAWFRMSPKLLGIMDEQGGADKLADAERTFDNKTARPLMNKLQRKISRELTQAWSLNYQIDYEYQMAPEDMARLSATYGAIPGIMVDDIRAFARLGKHPDKTIGEMTLNLPGQNGGTGQPGATPTRSGFPDQNLPGEPGRPPKLANTKPFPRNGAQLPMGAAARPAGKAMSLDDIVVALDQLPEGKSMAPAADTTYPNEVRPPDLLEQRRTSDVDAIVADLKVELADAGRVLERALYDEVHEGKAMEPKNSNLVARLRNSAAWATFRTMIDAALQRAIKRALSAATIHHGDVGVRPSSEVDYDSLAAELAHAKGTGVSAISQTLKTRVAAAVRSGRDEQGKAGADLLSHVKDAVEEWSTNQTETIALTELTRAYNHGTLDVAESAGLTHVSVSDGHDHDEPCQEADGQTWTIDHAREHVLEHPRCRRAFVPVG